MSISCVIVDDDRMAVEMLRHLVQKTVGLELTEVFLDPVDAVNFLARQSVDVMFLDVEMPGMSGLELLSALRQPPLVVLVSSKSSYALDAFEFDVADFLLKPPSYGRFLKTVEKIREKLEPEVHPKGGFIFVKSDSALVRVNLDDILWIEALADYVALVTPAKKHVSHGTMKSIESRLPPQDFLRVHRSYIVRLDKVDAIEDKMVRIGDKHIPIGGTYRDNLMNALNLF